MKKTFQLLLLSLCTLGFSNVLMAQNEASTTQNYVIPQKAEDISPLLYGEKVPHLTLKDANGAAFDLQKAFAEKPTILVFYRGGWCPYCSRQLAGLQNITADLKAMGYQILAVSTDKSESLAPFAAKEKLDYTLLSDANLNAAKQFGIAFKAPKNYWGFLPKTTGGENPDLLLPVPSVYILDKSGVILYEFINPDYQQRLAPEMLKLVAKQLITK